MTSVLVTGCAGAVGQGIIAGLSSANGNLRLIGSETDPYAAPFYLKDNKLEKVFHTTYVDSPEYIPELIEICRKEEVDIVFPGTDVELPKLAAGKEIFADYGAKVIVSPFETVEICRDKWLTFLHLEKAIPIVKSAVVEPDLHKAMNTTGFPAVLKPRVGWGSRVVYKVENIEEAMILAKNVNNPVIQTWLEGKEYTVDCMADKRGRIVCSVPRLRLKIFSGLSFEGVTVKNPKLIKLGTAIAENLEFYGPFNFQAKLVDGEPVVFEINPRFSGGGILTVRAGANIPLLSVQEACGCRSTGKVGFEEGVFFSRCFHEVIFRNSEVGIADG
jgi:carbamoyl-phosphate synthase large subunit